ncbi:hypothetical protein [Natrinema sp. DC36]|uniref:hypothetical protein n=1 Tax=Natrinema sp. DC36 TaxID=2878680 RepID=UPI001CF04491|nr:hypothetical protein [Natrinema sp. DC36]
MGGITRIISARATAKTFTSVSQTKNSLDQTDETTSEYSEDMWLFDPEERTTSEVAGERVRGDLGGLIIAEGDGSGNYEEPVERNDRIVHGGVEYEVDTIVGVPDDEEPNYWTISFIRRQ